MKCCNHKQTQLVCWPHCMPWTMSYRSHFCPACSHSFHSTAFACPWFQSQYENPFEVAGWAWNHVSFNGGCGFATVARWWGIVPQAKPTSACASMQDPFQHRAMVRLKCVFLSTATGTIAWHGFNHYESAVALLQTGHSRCLTCCMNGSWFFQIDVIKAMKNPAAR